MNEQFQQELIQYQMSYEILNRCPPDICTATCDDGKCTDPCPNGCPPCHSCGANGCAPDFDSSKCEICDIKTCSVVSKCKESNCEVCQNGRCQSTCNSSQCEECKDGSCVPKKRHVKNAGVVGY